jgi:hypothetical protein
MAWDGMFMMRWWGRRWLQFRIDWGIYAVLLATTISNWLDPENRVPQIWQEMMNRLGITKNAVLKPSNKEGIIPQTRMWIFWFERSRRGDLWDLFEHLKIVGDIQSPPKIAFSLVACSESKIFSWSEEKDWRDSEIEGDCRKCKWESWMKRKNKIRRK